MLKKMMLPLMLCLSLFMTACGQNESESAADNKTETNQDSGQTESERTHADSSMRLWLDEDGTLNIERPTLLDNKHSSEDQTWTIFVYMCGSNLESEAAAATDDMIEMFKANTDERVKFIVQTGGANEWQNDWNEADKLQRLAIYGGDVVIVDEQPIADMGDSQTLEDFLRWGIEEYPAENFGLVFWNHGGGSISGVCFDEKYDNHSLTLNDIDEALLNINDMLERNFEFIGFDACLMGTFEAANMLASHAYYMYGSQEVESGYGWDYTAVGNYLMENPDADGAGLGQTVADSYYSVLEADEYEDSDSVAMAVIDLSKMDALTIAFNTYAKNLYEATEDSGNLSEVIRSVLKADNYGGNNRSVGYTNMVDLGGLISSCSGYAAGADEVEKALKSAVSYEKKGSTHADAGGLSLYYPLEIQGSTELRTFSEVAVSPYYFAYVARIAYGGMNSGDVSGFDDTGIIDSWGSEYADSTDWSYYDSAEQTGESPLITFDSEPAVNENGTYGFKLTQEAIDNASSVQAIVYMFSDDLKNAISLGQSTDIAENWETGEFSDNFDGYWFSLPDGQKLSVFSMSEGDGYDVYTSPVEVNGERTNLVFTHDYINNTITIDGVWDGVEANGMVGRTDSRLQEGDKIVPVYSSYDVDTFEDGEYSGEEYIYTEGAQLEFDLLYDGEYMYGFAIYDIYGDFYMTDFVSFSVDGSNVYYNASSEQ